MHILLLLLSFGIVLYVRYLLQLSSLSTDRGLLNDWNNPHSKLSIPAKLLVISRFGLILGQSEPKFRPQSKNGKQLKLQIIKIRRKHMVNRVSSSFPKGTHSTKRRHKCPDLFRWHGIEPASHYNYEATDPSYSWLYQLVQIGHPVACCCMRTEFWNRTMLYGTKLDLCGICNIPEQTRKCLTLFFQLLHIYSG